MIPNAVPPINGPVNIMSTSREPASREGSSFDYYFLRKSPERVAERAGDRQVDRYMSTADGLNTPKSSPLTHELRGIARFIMEKDGGLSMPGILPRDGTLDFLKPMNLDKATVKGLVDSWQSAHPGESLPPELASVAGTMGIRTAGGDARAGRTPGGRDNERRESSTHRTNMPERTVEQRAEKIMSFLQKELRLTKAQAAGVLGNFLQEDTPLDPAKGGDNGNSLGIAQWNGPRKRALFAYAREHGGHATSLDTQLQFLKHELLTSERGALKALMRTSTPEQAALAFSRKYERPGDPRNQNRVRYARIAYRNYGDTQIASAE